MENKTVSKKVPIILAIVWLVVGMGVVCCMMPQMILMKGAFANWKVQMLIFLAETVFSVAMMVVIRVLSVKAQIKWLAIISKVLLIVYGIIAGIAVLAFAILLLIY